MKQHFAEKVLTWFDTHGRKNLPWQQNVTAYRVWVSEIMLQQTQVATVIPYYQRFMESFPDIITLANADEDLVLQHWAGLGYYSRARNLHKAAKQLRDEFSATVPCDLENLQSLAGIGRSTAGAILSLAYGQRQAILDGNVKRVLTRYHAIEGWSGKSHILRQLWQIAESHLPDTRYANYTQAMMDLGSTVCTRSKPKCLGCPIHADCTAFQAGNPTAYPTPKPKKKLPEKKAIFLLLMNADNEIFIMKRPPSGIWGGLWSLPQFDTYSQAQQWYTHYFSTDLPIAIDESHFSHTFSHFRLQAQTLLITQSTSIKRVMEGTPSLWYNNSTTFMGGFPAPIKTLLTRIFK